MSQADDRIIEDLLRRRREEPRPSGGPLCGDPELLAPFVEDALAGSAREDMDRHLAACAACREAVARLVRLAPRPAVAASPQPQLAWWKRWAWAAPALASVVLVGSFVMFNRGRIVEQPQLVAKQQPVVPAVGADQPRGEPAKPESARQVPETRERRPARKNEARAAAPTAAPPPVSAAGEKEKVKEEAAAIGRAEVKTEAKPDAEVPKVQTTAQAQAQQAFREKDSAGARQSQTRDQAQVQVQASPAPPQQQSQVFAKAPAEAKRQDESAKGAIGGLAGGVGQAKLAGPMLRTAPSAAKPSAETVVVESAASNVLADDRLDKLDKNKKLGLLLSKDTKVAQTVRVKNSSHVWTLLADGRLFLSFDGGATWKEVAVPERPKSVKARDITMAEITGVSGRVYRSTDGGASWWAAAPR